MNLQGRPLPGIQTTIGVFFTIDR